MRQPPPVKAIRAFCLECSGDQPSEVRKCPIIKCPLFPFRFGTNPNRTGIGPGRILVVSKTPLESSNFEKSEVVNAEAKTF